MAAYSAIWQPLKIGHTSVKHRIFASAHTMGFGVDNLPTARHAAYYAERAKGGASLLITEQLAAHRTGWGGASFWLKGYEERVIPSLNDIARAVHPHDCKVLAQVVACGHQEWGDMHLDNFHEVLAPSAIPSSLYGEIPRAMEQAVIDAVVAGFGTTALHCKTAGLDGIEVHGAHGYLITNFFSPLTNHRTDGYVGSTRNRARIGVEIAEAVRKRCGRDFIVGIRISGDELIEGGLRVEEAEEIVAILNETRLYDYFSVSWGNYHSIHTIIPPMNVARGFMVPLGRRIKQAAGTTPVFIAGRILDLDMAERIIQDGSADMVAMTRAQIADPEFVAKARAGREAEIRPCIGGNYCSSRVGSWAARSMMTCIHNPAVGREHSWGVGTLERATTPKKVVIVGGGPAGLKAAEVAATRGHHVILFERANRLGGQVPYIAALPTRGDWSLMIDYLDRELQRLNVDVRLGREATPDAIAAERPDAVVVATGSRADLSGYTIARGERLGIPGIETANVLSIEGAIEQPERCGRRVLIVDDRKGYAPLGLAEYLADRGCEVEIITRHMYVGIDTGPTLDLPFIYPRLVQKGVKLTPQTYVERVSGSTVTAYNIWGGPQRTVEVDSIVVDTHRFAEDTLYQQLREQFKSVRRIGDCVAPRHVGVAIYEGERAAREL